jgi:general L-amino acid transport system permease protein
LATNEREAAPPRIEHHRPPPWRDVRVLRVFFQVVFLVAVAATLWYLARNLTANMRAAGIRTDFAFLDQSAGFAISGAQEFSSRDSIWEALVVGFRNTLRVSAAAIVLATVLGVVIGVARLSANWLVRKSAAGFVEGLRNVPLLVFLFFLYIAVLQQLPPIHSAVEPPGLVLSNRGVWVPWLARQEGAESMVAVVLVALALGLAVAVWRTVRFNATGTPHHRALWAFGVVIAITVTAWVVMGRPLVPTLPVRTERVVDGGYRMTVEQGALIIGLVLYMAAFIAEIVRGSILAVPKGQTEAANALGLSGLQRLRYVILPQALRVAIPPTGNEYLNTAKNSSLGVLIAFPETLRVARIAIGNGYPAPQLLGIMLVFFLSISLVLALLTNTANWLVQRRGRR